jgi:hypothetical protein
MEESRFLSSKLKIYSIPAFKNSGKSMNKIKFYLKTEKYFRHKKIIAFTTKILKFRTEILISLAKAKTKVVLQHLNKDSSTKSKHG